MADETTTTTPNPPAPQDRKPAAVFATEEQWARARGKLKAEGADEVVESLGFVRMEDLKAAIAAAKELPAVKGALDKLQAQHGEVASKYAGLVKRDAVMKHAQKFSDADIAAEIIGAKLTVKPDGSVEAPEGKPIDKFIDELLEARPVLKAAAFKGGTGTSPHPPKAPAAAPDAGKTNGDNAPRSLKDLAALAGAIHRGEVPIQ